MQKKVYFCTKIQISDEKDIFSVPIERHVPEFLRGRRNRIRRGETAEPSGQSYPADDRYGPMAGASRRLAIHPRRLSRHGVLLYPALPSGDGQEKRAIGV